MILATGQKLRLLAGVNGGVLTAVKPALVVGGVNPGPVAGGVNPALLGGAGFLGQPQFGQVSPSSHPFQRFSRPGSY